MPRAEIIAGDPHLGCCPNCGAEGLPSIRVMTAKALLAWMGCSWCYEAAMRRGQLSVLQSLCRQADAQLHKEPLSSIVLEASSPRRLTRDGNHHPHQGQ